MSAEDLERYETEMELQLYREYRDVVRMFSYIVETERRFYLANEVEVTPHEVGGDIYFELQLRDAWVWDMYRPARFVPGVRVLTYRDVNVEELPKEDPSALFSDDESLRTESADGPSEAGSGGAGGSAGPDVGGPTGGASQAGD